MKNVGGSRQNSILGFKRRAILIYLLYLFTNFNYKILLLFLLVIQTVPRDTNSRYFYFYFFFEINKKKSCICIRFTRFSSFFFWRVNLCHFHHGILIGQFKIGFGY